MSAREIADRLEVTHPTVAKYRQRIASQALRLGIAPTPEYQRAEQRVTIDARSGRFLNIDDDPKTKTETTEGGAFKGVRRFHWREEQRLPYTTTASRRIVQLVLHSARHADLYNARDFDAVLGRHYLPSIFAIMKISIAPPNPPPKSR